MGAGDETLSVDLYIFVKWRGRTLMSQYEMFLHVRPAGPTLTTSVTSGQDRNINKALFPLNVLHRTV